MKLPVRIEVSDLRVRSPGPLHRDVAEAVDLARLLLGPGEGAAGAAAAAGGWVDAVLLGFVGGGHGVVVGSVVFGMHVGGWLLLLWVSERIVEDVVVGERIVGGMRRGREEGERKGGTGWRG